jgi:uncharacterized protein (TIGR02001 family)
MKKFLIAAALLASATVAQAQVTGNVGVTSDYRFRGISQTQKASALQGGLDYSHSSGVYVGNWNSNVSSASYRDSAGLEHDLYGGFKKEIVKGLELDVGTYNYIFNRTNSRFDSNANTHELYVGLTRGPVSVKASQSISDYFGLANSSGTRYLEANINQPVAKDVTLNAHVGRTMYANHSNLNYTDYRVGGTVQVAGVGVGVHYVGNTQFGSGTKAANTLNGMQLYKEAVVVSVSKSF